MPQAPRTSARTQAAPPWSAGGRRSDAAADRVVDARLLAHAVDETVVGLPYGRGQADFAACTAETAVLVAVAVAASSHLDAPASPRVLGPRERGDRRLGPSWTCRAGRLERERPRGRARASRRGSSGGAVRWPAAAEVARATAPCLPGRARWRWSRSRAARACTAAATRCWCRDGRGEAALERWYRGWPGRSPRDSTPGRARRHVLQRADDPRPAHALGPCSERGDVVQLAAAARARAGRRLRRRARGLSPRGDGPLAEVLAAAGDAGAGLARRTRAGCAATGSTLGFEAARGQGGEGLSPSAGVGSSRAHAAGPGGHRAVPRTSTPPAIRAARPAQLGPEGDLVGGLVGPRVHVERAASRSGVGGRARVHSRARVERLVPATAGLTRSTFGPEPQRQASTLDPAASGAAP